MAALEINSKKYEEGVLVEDLEPYPQVEGTWEAAKDALLDEVLKYIRNGGKSYTTKEEEAEIRNGLPSKARSFKFTATREGGHATFIISPSENEYWAVHGVSDPHTPEEALLVWTTELYHIGMNKKGLDLLNLVAKKDLPASQVLQNLTDLVRILDIDLTPTGYDHPLPIRL